MHKDQVIDTASRTNRRIITVGAFRLLSSLRNKRRFAFFSLTAFAPLGIAGYFLGTYVKPVVTNVLFTALTVLWLANVLVAWISLLRSECPYCSRSFYRPGMAWEIFLSRCIHCKSRLNGGGRRSRRIWPSLETIDSPECPLASSELCCAQCGYLLVEPIPARCPECGCDLLDS